MQLSSRAQLVHNLLYPKSIAIVGARPSDAEGDLWSFTTFTNLTKHLYSGPIYPVNPNYDTLWGLTCYPDLTAIPEVPDQVLIRISAKHIMPVIDSSARLGVRSAVIYSAGFGEDLTTEGLERRRALELVLNDFDLAVCGPNCLGYASFPSRTVANYGPEDVRTDGGGTIGIVGQSGGASNTFRRLLTRRGVMPRYCISSGNEMGLTVEDYLEFFLSDPAIKAVAIYNETLKDPKRFARLAALAASRQVPIVITKVGTSQEAQLATIAHTGRIAGSGRVFADIAAEWGVIVTRTIDEALDIVSAYRPGYVPKSRRLGGVSISGGMRSILLDSAAHWGMEFPPLSNGTLAKLDFALGPGMAKGNPFDVGLHPELVVSCTGHVVTDPGNDAVVVQSSSPKDIIPPIDDLAASSGKLVTLVGPGFSLYDLVPEGRSFLAQARAVGYAPSADRAVAALRRLADYNERVSRLAVTSASATIDATSPSGQEEPCESPVTEVYERYKAIRGASFALDENEAKGLLARYGLEAPRRCRLDSLEGLASSLVETGYPAILKVVSQAVPHKSAVGLISRLVQTHEEAAAEYQRLSALCGEILDDNAAAEIWLEQAVFDGVECVVGASRDRELGLVMMFGTGGAGVEIYDDVKFSLPVTCQDEALGLVAATKVGQVILRGYPERPSYDVGALVRALLRVGQICDDGRDLIEAVDINPLLVRGPNRGTIALDALVRFNYEI